MSDPHLSPPAFAAELPSPDVRIAWEVARIGRQLATLIEHCGDETLSGSQRGQIAASDGFLRQAWEELAQLELETHYSEPQLRRLPGIEDPLDRITAGCSLSPCELDMLLLAGMPEEHEGYASALQSLHPRGEPWPTVGLAAQLFAPGLEARQALRRLAHRGPGVSAGLLQIEADGPLFNRSLRLARGAWSAIHGIADSIPGVHEQSAPLDMLALAPWLSSAEVERAVTAIRRRAPVTIVVLSEDPRVGFARGLALVEAASSHALGLWAPATMSRELQVRIAIRALAFAHVPVLELEIPASAEQAQAAALPEFRWFSAPLLLSTTRTQLRIRGERPVICLECPPLPPASTRGCWARALPTLAEHAPSLAARFPLEPALIYEVAEDLRVALELDGRPTTPADVLASVRARVGVSQRPGVIVRQPRATWDDLILSVPRMTQLRELVARVRHQPRVLDEWGFLSSRPGARGVRALFSGPPGTGKTLSAEVIARALDTDLMIIDLSRLVSKWIGETEKNLAEVFLAAERSRAVLLFDEADALFGKRTEVSDAHDRYANLETAYLLTRLEQYDGLAVLSTNMRHNIDVAFVRRLEFMVEYARPNRKDRLALWRAHIPAHAPLADDVDLSELASLYPIVGGLIRNAAVAAAFLAAEANSSITRDHLMRAIRREYEKTGAAFPGDPGPRRA